MRKSYPHVICKIPQTRYHDFMTKKKKREKGVNISVSPRAHAKMSKEIIGTKPKLDLRGKVNILNGLSAEE